MHTDRLDGRMFSNISALLAILIESDALTIANNVEENNFDKLLVK